MDEVMDGKHEDLLRRMRKRYAYCVEIEQDMRKDAVEALRFSNLDQWPEDIRSSRETSDSIRPCLVMDKINQYVRQVVNDQRQNRPSIKVRPADSRAADEVAEVMDGLVRHIESISNAGIAYDTAFEYAVRIGFGYFRIITDYVSDGSMEQEIFIRRIKNPMSVHIDPDCDQPDGSDARYAFITDEIDEDEFKLQYPDAVMSSFDVLDGTDREYWYSANKIRIAEYFEVEEIAIKLAQNPMTGEIVEVTEQNAALVQGFPTRPAKRRSVCWYKCTGAEVIAHREWPGRYIPIIPVWGNELWIEGKRKITGMVKAAIDPQRMYNYFASNLVEQIALQPRAPWIAADGQIEDYKEEWEQANSGNLAVLQYKPQSIGGVAVPPPQRVQPPMPSPGFAAAMQQHERDIQAALGMYQASLGQQSNEKSGIAILNRQREGDVGSFHYVDNLSRAIQHAGAIIVDLIPKIYDTPRIFRVLGEDGGIEQANHDPDMPAPYHEEEQPETGETVKIYNLGVGRYDVTISAGASFSTRRQESAAAMLEVIRANPGMMQIIGDLMVRNMDWPGAEAIADRLKKMLPPPLQENPGKGGPPPEQMQAIIQQLEQQLQEMDQQLQQAMAEANDKSQDRALKSKEIDAKIHAELIKALASIETAKNNLTPEELIAKQADAPESDATESAIASMGIAQQPPPEMAQYYPADMPQEGM